MDDFQTLYKGHELFVDPIKIVKKDKCKEKYQNVEELGFDRKSEQTLCAQTLKSNSVPIGGAPLVCYFGPGPDLYFHEPMLSGIAMNIGNQNNGSDPIIYTKVAYFVDVLKKLFKEEKAEIRSNAADGTKSGIFPILVTIYQLM